MKALYTLLTVFAFTTICHSQFENRPIIGILSIPAYFQNYSGSDWSYIAASYVKFLESGGAQVVPIPYDLPQTNLTYILNRVNGVLFTGGTGDIINTTFGNTTSYIVNYVVQQNQKGKYFPLWGTCMGFETIACELAQNYSVLTSDCVGGQGVNSNNFINSNYTSRMLSQIPQDLPQKMATQNLSYFDHVSMIHTYTFENSSPLNKMLTPVTFSYDAAGNQFVSAYESPSMPIYGIQFHAEKSTFEWKDPVNHSLDAVRLQQYLSNFFVNETRKNTNSFSNQQQFLIDNYETTIVSDSSYNTLYLFPTQNSTIVSNASNIVDVTPKEFLEFI